MKKSYIVQKAEQFNSGVCFRSQHRNDYALWLLLLLMLLLLLLRSHQGRRQRASFVRAVADAETE
jgi:hypothetical protein